MHAHTHIHTHTHTHTHIQAYGLINKISDFMHSHTHAHTYACMPAHTPSAHLPPFFNTVYIALIWFIAGHLS